MSCKINKEILNEVVKSDIDKDAVDNLLMLEERFINSLEK